MNEKPERLSNRVVVKNQDGEIIARFWLALYAEIFVEAMNRAYPKCMYTIVDNRPKIKEMK